MSASVTLACGFFSAVLIGSPFLVPAFLGLVTITRPCAEATLRRRKLHAVRSFRTNSALRPARSRKLLHRTPDRSHGSHRPRPPPALDPPSLSLSPSRSP